MKFNKQIALILLLGSLLISAISIIYTLYNENKKIQKEENKLITVYIATKTLEKGTLIKESYIKETKKRKKDILNIPLTKEEILNKYTNEKIFKNEVFLKIKIIDKIKKEKPIIVKKEFTFNSYNIPFELFNNPNYSLKPNDTINIISVYDKNYEKVFPNYSVQYIATNINVLGFLINGKESKKAIEKRWVKKETLDENEKIEVKAQEILLDIKSETLLSLIEDYNKGKQLWMVKTIKDKKTIEKKKEAIKTPAKKYIKRKKKIPIEKAIIEYKDNPSLNKIQTQKIIPSKITKTQKTKALDLSNRCKKPNNTHLLLGIAKKFNIREQPSIESQIIAKRYKDSLFRYRQKTKDNWYELCDGSYVHKNMVIEISYKKAIKYFKEVKKYEK